MAVEQYREFENERMAALWGEQHYGEWSREYKHNIKAIEAFIKNIAFNPVGCYCGYDFKPINNYLRGVKERGTTIADVHKDMVKILSVLLAFAPKVPENIIVYRLVSEIFANKLLSSKGMERVCDEGFISTSLTKNIINAPEHFGRYTGEQNLLKIYVMRGTSAVYTAKIIDSNPNDIDDEQEMLFLPSGWFRLVKEPYEYNGKFIFECSLYYPDQYPYILKYGLRDRQNGIF